MRILFHVYIPSTPRAAGIQQTIRVAYYMARVGAHVSLHVGSWYFKNKQELLEFFGFADHKNFEVFFYRNPLQRFNHPRLAYAGGSIFHFLRLVKLLLTSEKKRYDFFFARGHRFPAFHVFFRPVLKYRVVYEIHEILYLENALEEELLTLQVRPDFERYTYCNADGVIAISHALKKLAQAKWGAPAKITVIPSGGILFPSNPLPKGKPLSKLFFIGNFYPVSGIDTLIRALPKIPEATLTVIGGGGRGAGDFERVSALAQEVGALERIDFRGFVEPHLLPQAYQEAEVLIMPMSDFVRTRHFASPLKMFEYMSARRPIVATDLPTVTEILKDDCNAVLAKPDDPDSLADAIERTIQDPETALCLAEQAYKDVQKYSMERKCEAIYAFLEEIL
jgi:glycosyltransferase involved in cell wall biosynthesis